HDTHTHPFIPPTSGVTGGTFTIDPLGHTEADVWYRIHLTVTDSEGLEHRVYHDILPRVATLRLRTDPSGLEVRLDGQPRTTPYNDPTVAGLQRSLEAPLIQVKDNRIWLFDSWSDGGAAAHDITVPATSTTYTAVYVEAVPEAHYFQTNTPTLTWNRVSWEAGYEIKVSSSDDFASPDYVINALSASKF